MNRMLSAAAVSGAVTTVSSLIQLNIVAWVDQNDGVVRMGGFPVVLLPVALILVPATALIAGFGGGWVGRTVAAVIGSLGAYLAINLGTVILRGGNLSTDGFGLGAYVVLITLLVAGHLTGVAIRPRLRPA